MQKGKFNLIVDQAWGSSGKGKTSSWLVDKFNVGQVSSSNMPNAGHSVVFGKEKFVAKAIPTAAALKKFKGAHIDCFISPGSGFSWEQLIKEWNETGRPKIFVHDRSSIVTEEHKNRESSGGDSTKHIASTMQGTAAAIVDKVLRKSDVLLAGTKDSKLEKEIHEARMAYYNNSPLMGDQEYDFKREKLKSMSPEEAVRNFINQNENLKKLLEGSLDAFVNSVLILTAWDFREVTRWHLKSGRTWFHEGSQGYALSIDHGSQYPFVTSRNCTTQSYMDHMAIPPNLVGDVYLNLRTFPIRVGNVVENGVQKGYSGDFYPDCKELSWDEVAKISGMPENEAKILAERERTTVTKRVRRVSTFSHLGLQDAVLTNGATKLCVNFVQYLNWKDNGLRGEGKKGLEQLSKETREFITKVEETAGIPVVFVGTGADHDDVIYCP